MKIHTLIASLALVVFTSPVFAVTAKTAARLELISKEMKAVDACKNHYLPRDFNPATFGKDKQKYSLLAFASQGSVMVGNDAKAFQLILDKGIIQSVNNGKSEKITYSIDPKAFNAQLASMDKFLNQALDAAQKDGKSKDVQYVSCASAIVKSAKKYHSV